MVTALIVRERADLSDEVVISETANAVGAAELDLPPGGGYTVEELLYALLLASSNEAAVALGEHVAGSEADFVRLMNQRAEVFGWEGTQFVTTHGLDQPGHYSTAEDLAAIGKELLGDRVLARIVATADASITGPQGEIALANRNLLLESYRGALGVKTGFTALAGNVLVAAAERSGRRVITVAMNSDDSFVDSAALLDFGFARLRRSIAVPSGTRVGGLVFEGSGSTGVVSAEPVRGLLEPDELKLTFEPRSMLSLPIEKGQGVGVLKIRDERGRLLKQIDAVAERGVEEEELSLAQRAFSGLLRGVASVFGGA